MSNVAKLKKEAADLEEKKQFDKAVKVYAKLFAEFEKHPQEVDAALFNRVGDLQVKLGQVAEAVDTYEKGVDYYAEGGFFNNAIALCNKILRQTPGRASIYYKLGKSARKRDSRARRARTFWSMPTGWRRRARPRSLPRSHGIHGPRPRPGRCPRDARRAAHQGRP